MSKIKEHEQELLDYVNEQEIDRAFEEQELGRLLDDIEKENFNMVYDRGQIDGLITGLLAGAAAGMLVAVGILEITGNI